MNNCEWLLNMTYEQREEWFKAEHADGDMDNDVSVQKCPDESCRQYADQGERAELPDCESDSREKLEADAIQLAQNIWHQGMNYANGVREVRHIAWQERDVINLLDRQAAITEHECRKPNWDYCETCEALEGLREALDQQRAATANANDLWGRARDELAAVKRERDNLADDLLASNREREHLREALGIALDHAHDVLALVNLDGEVVS